MRKVLMIAAATAALATPVLAAEPYPNYPNSNPAAPADVTVGAVTGTAVGVGVAEGWFGTTVAGTVVPATALGGVAIGGVAGVGAASLFDAAVQPCRGFQAMFLMHQQECAARQAAIDNAQLRPVRHVSRASRTVVR